MAEDDNCNAYSSSGSSGNDFCVLSEEDIASADDLGLSTQDEANQKYSYQQLNIDKAESSGTFGISAPVDVEVIKRKAEAIAKSLQKTLSKVSKSANTSSSFENCEVRDDLKQHRERSLYVEQKLKEDRKLFEESKKRSEAVLDKVQSAKRIQESINENVKELSRKESDDTHSLKLKIQSLEDTVFRLQESLSNRNRIISEKNEQIRGLNQSVSDMHGAYMHSLEQSELEIDRVKNEYKKSIEEVNRSKEELCNQLQLVRKNYLIVENDLKLSDFARSQLVNRNAELQERIKALEKDNERLSTQLSDESDDIQQSRDSQAVVIDDIRPKIENLIIITNEFSTFLADDLNDVEDLNMEDDNDLSQAVDTIGDKLETAFFTMRDKLSSVPKLQSKVQKMNNELKHMDSLLCQNKEQIAELQQQLSATQMKLEKEIKEKTRLAESIRNNESWQNVSQNFDDVNQEIPSTCDISDSAPTEANLHLEQLSQECLQLNMELESKSNTVKLLTSNIDSLNDTIQKLQQERRQLLGEIDEKSSELDIMRRNHNEVCSQLKSLKEDQSCISSQQFHQLSHEYQVLQQTCRELESNCDRLNAELQDKCEQLEKLRAHQEEQFEKEENDFVVLQTRDCDEEDNLKRQCMQLKDENEKLVATMRNMSEKAMEFENERLTLQKYVNECSRLQDVVKQLSQELETAKKHLYQTNMASRETEEDKDEEIKGLQDEMAKLEGQLSEVWDQLHEEKTLNCKLNKQLGSCENTNATMSQEMQQLKGELEFLQKSNEELQLKIQSFTEIRNSDELLALQEHSLQLQKMLDLAHHEHQTTKNQLQTTQNSLKELQMIIVNVEDLQCQNRNLQVEISELSQKYSCLEDSYNKMVELIAKKDTELNTKTFEAQRSFQELRQTLTALNEAQSDLQFARNEIEKANRDLEDSQTITIKTQQELQNAQKELEIMTVRLHESEKSVEDLTEKYNCEAETLQNSLATIQNENAALKQQCKTYHTYFKNLQTHMNHIVNVASRTSDDAINIVHRLQSQWPQPKLIANAEIQCSTEIETDVQQEAETYELLLKDMREELSTLKQRYEEVKEELFQKDNTCDAEVSRYGNLVAELRNELSSVYEHLRQQTQEFQFLLQSSKSDHIQELQQYQNQIEQLQKKLYESRKPEVAETSVQVSIHTERSTVNQNISVAKQDPRYADIELPATHVTKSVDTSREIIEKIVTLATFLENKNKYLVDAITFLEEIIVSSHPSETIRFQSVIEYWQKRVTIDDDVIDHICEEYDIIPEKFVPGDQLVQWKEQMTRCIEIMSTPLPPPISPVPSVKQECSILVTNNLQSLKKKMHKLICDLHYVYKDQETFNPADFFGQIEDINHSVETTAKIALGQKEKRVEQAAKASHEVHDEHHEHDHEDDHDHDSDHHKHHYHEHDHTFHHHHKDHDHDDISLSRESADLLELAEEHDQRDTVADLKNLLGESNKKIDSLVKELMEVKSSREYNEVQQLHIKLDETLYQLHLRDVHVVELTRELTQLLAERDSLQLKLSNIIRQNEQLRQISVSNVVSDSVVMQLPDLENKLEELQAVNYMKDPRISEASKKYHVTGMQLYHEEQKSKEETSTSIVPSILKWFTGDTEN